MNMIKAPYRRMVTAGLSLALLAGCGKRDSASRQVLSGREMAEDMPTERTGFQPTRIDDPRLSLLPLAPGFSWTYRTTGSSKPVNFRFFTRDFVTGNAYIAALGSAPMNDNGMTTGTVRYTVTGDKREFAGKNSMGYFYRIDEEQLGEHGSVTNQNILYWGRERYSTMDVALCEVRDMDPTARQFIQAACKGFDTSGVWSHRYLGGDVMTTRDAGWIKPGQLCAPALNIDGEQWLLTTGTNFETVVVPAGEFVVSPTTFSYSLGSHRVNNITEKLYFSFGCGLIKWVQYDEGREVWKSELVSYNLPPTENSPAGAGGE